MMSKKQTLNLRQAANNTIDIPLATLCRYNPSKTFAQSHTFSRGTVSSFLKPSLCWRYNQLLSKSTPNAGGTYSCFLKSPLRS